jgi:DNA-binding MarR family transcriptional regulator
MSRQPTHKERTERAVRAYLDLLDAEEGLKAALRGPLELVDLTLEGFRLLEMLDREGALTIADLTKRRGRDWDSTYDVIARLEKHGWVRRATVRLPPVEFERAHLPKSKKNEPREGRRIAVVGLTASGKEFIGGVLTRYSKVVSAIMRGIDPREQETLSRICRKLREGDAVKFVREIRMEDEE